MNITAPAMVDGRIEAGCAHFLFREAECLDRRQFDDWLALMHPQVDYRIPVRTTRLVKEGDGFSSVSFFMKEDLGTLSMRVARLKSDYAWSENPASRTRRMVSNIRVADAGAQGEYDVTANIAVYCYRGDKPTPVILTGERQDRLVSGSEGWCLKKRLVLLDITVLEMDSLSIFL